MVSAPPSPRTLPGRPHDLTSYTGALLIYAMVSVLRNSAAAQLSEFFSLGLILWACHFVRRITECLWVHRYAGRRVPLGDALGEYAYYWGFAAWIAYGSPSRTLVEPLVLLGVCLFVVGEIGNAWAHLKLRALRRPNTQDRGIPNGGLFNWVSSANYSYEILAWLGFGIAIRTPSAWLYFAGVVGVLASWAKKRQSRYHSYFDGKGGRPAYPKERRALVPWLFIVI